MAVVKGNSQGSQANGAGGNGNGRSTWPSRGKGYSVPGSGVTFPPLRNRLKALVVDDMSACYRYERAILQSFGVETDVAETGEEAVEIFANGAYYDLVLIEKYLTIYAMTGVEATRRIRGMGFQGKMLAVTAFTSQSDRFEFFDAGIDAYLIKPITHEMIWPYLLQIDNQIA
ncbi:hypothetical protein MLD38_028192 [Melastoma candidum]|uniref:Uncharacterized protein n=1 Tax=Melastoma candidum TaxID=119954 RepID=A0ACB9N1L7_9MYRT|nr:hypothetical protein MLD38_028192 [Melastoma candidum]